MFLDTKVPLSVWNKEAGLHKISTEDCANVYSIKYQEHVWWK